MAKGPQNLTKFVKKTHRGTQKSVKRYGKKLKKEAKQLRKSTEAHYEELNLGQKLKFYGVALLLVAVLAAISSRPRR